MGTTQREQHVNTPHDAPRATRPADRPVNIAAHLPAMARRRPDAPAIIYPTPAMGPPQPFHTTKGLFQIMWHGRLARVFTGGTPVPQRGSTPGSGEKTTGRVFTGETPVPQRGSETATRGTPAPSSGYVSVSFRQLDEETDRFAHGLTRAGITRGTRVILMVRPRIEFFVLTFALYKVGAVPVLIDPGMGRRRMVDCLRGVGAEAFIGIPLAHVLRTLYPSAFRSVRVNITVGRRCGWGGLRMADLRTDPWQPFEPAPTAADDPAAIIFTSGSTGPPKGVLYRHGMFDAQVRLLREHFRVEPGETDLPTFPLFALFDPALGMTAVLPDMNPTRPGFVDPQKIIGAIRDQAVTHMFGSPALLDRVACYGAANGVLLPTLRRVISAGAPVPPATLERFRTMLDDAAEIYTPYGATEALPVTSIGSREILGETRRLSEQGRGTCVGRPVPEMAVRIIPIRDGPIASWRDDLALPPGEIGEIVVKGPVVTREYCTDPEATRLAKIVDLRGSAMEGPARGCATARTEVRGSLAVSENIGEVWHRMGDAGYLDEQGRLWFCGRKAHRVQTAGGTMFTVPCEAIFNVHPAVARSALVGVGRPPNQTPVMCVELDREHRRIDRRKLTAELIDRARAQKHTRAINAVLYHPRFPVDIRHNAKIFREKLAAWAERKITGRS